MCSIKCKISRSYEQLTDKFPLYLSVIVFLCDEINTQLIVAGMRKIMPNNNYNHPC